MAVALVSTAVARRLRRTAGTRRTVPPKLLWSCLGLTVAAVLTVFTLNWRTDVGHDRAADFERAFERAIGEARFLDEALTMTARLAVVTNEPGLRERYSQLDSAFQGTQARLRDMAALSGGAAGAENLARAAERLFGTAGAASAASARRGRVARACRE